MDEKDRMNTPETREEFERRLHRVWEQARQDQLSFHIGTKLAQQGLLRTRCLPNGRIDMLSVDEITRLQANTMHWMMTDQRLQASLQTPEPPSLESSQAPDL